MIFPRPTHLLSALLALAMLAGPAWAEALTKEDVTRILGQAAKATQIYAPNSTIAILDREGFVLAVYGTSGTPSGLQVINAIDKAGTAAFLSSNAEAFTSRTAGYIIQPHFPPDVHNKAPGPLVGVGLSSLPFSDVNHFRNPKTPALGIANTSLSGNPGGVPLYKNGDLVGGLGIDSSGSGILSALVYVAGSSIDENNAVIAQNGFNPPGFILATQVLINGIRLPYTSVSRPSLGTVPLKAANFSPDFPATASPGKSFKTATASPFSGLPGEVRDPIKGSRLPPVNGQARLSQSEVTEILRLAAARAKTTRGAIRNPAGTAAQVFIVVVDYYANTTTPNAPTILGSFRTPDATIFSYDVAAQKARTALFFSNNSMAMSTRAVGFLAQGTFPPGIDNTAAGPYGPTNFGSTLPFPGPLGLQTKVSFAPPNYSSIPLVPINAYLPNGITIFPGGFPLYRNGVLIGAIGISGDGVDQDDLIGAAGTVNFLAPNAIRSDEFTYRGARLPYAKFPQNASL